MLVVVCVARTCVMARLFLCHCYCQGVIRSAIFFGVFLEVFDTFGQKPKNLENPCRYKLVS